MKGYAFLWIFGVKVREAIIKNKATNQAFVSTRIMENLRETYRVYRDILNDKSKSDKITSPKTVVDAWETFFGLFKETPRMAILKEVDFEGFKRIVEQKNQMKYDSISPNFDTKEELDVTKEMVEKNKKEIKEII